MLTALDTVRAEYDRRTFAYAVRSFKRFDTVITVLCNFFCHSKSPVYKIQNIFYTIYWVCVKFA